MSFVPRLSRHPDLEAMSKSWNKRAEKKAKEVKRLQSLRRYLIVCEDAKSSLLYLKAFPYDRALVQVESEGGCGETLSVVNRGIALRAEALKAGTPFVETYCVIDRDDHPEDRYRNAFQLANQFNDLHVIWANEAFELWYLLHFQYVDAGLRRELLNERVSAEIKAKYDKADDSIFQRLLTQQETAIKNADRLEKYNAASSTPWMENPSTNVHVLVKVLNKLSELTAVSISPTLSNPDGVE